MLTSRLVARFDFPRSLADTQDDATAVMQQSVIPP